MCGFPCYLRGNVTYFLYPIGTIPLVVGGENFTYTQ